MLEVALDEGLSHATRCKPIGAMEVLTLFHAESHKVPAAASQNGSACCSHKSKCGVGITKNETASQKRDTSNLGKIASRVELSKVREKEKGNTG